MSKDQVKRLRDLAAAGDVDRLGEFFSNHLEDRQQLLNVALLRAAHKGQMGAVKYLEEEGASVHFADEKGRTALFFAILFEHYEVATFLISQHANIDHTDGQGNTPLILAAEKGKADVVRYLLDRDADADIQGVGGATALHRALKKHKRACMEFLLPETNLALADDEGKTPEMIAALDPEVFKQFKAAQQLKVITAEGAGGLAPPQRPPLVHQDSEDRFLDEYAEAQARAARVQAKFELRKQKIEADKRVTQLETDVGEVRERLDDLEVRVEKELSSLGCEIDGVRDQCSAQYAQLEERVNAHRVSQEHFE